MTLIELPELMPVMRFALMQRLIVQASTWREDYVFARAEMLASGWVFEDIESGEPGSVATLIENSLFNPDEPTEGNAWESFYDGTGYLPRNDVEAWVSNENILYFLGWGDLPIEHDWESWDTMLPIGVAGDRYFRFVLGIMQRVVVLHFQHRIAKVIENVLSLDHRGRPLEE